MEDINDSVLFAYPAVRWNRPDEATNVLIETELLYYKIQIGCASYYIERDSIRTIFSNNQLDLPITHHFENMIDNNSGSLRVTLLETLDRIAVNRLRDRSRPLNENASIINENIAVYRLENVLQNNNIMAGGDLRKKYYLVNY